MKLNDSGVTVYETTVTHNNYKEVNGLGLSSTKADSMNIAATDAITVLKENLRKSTKTGIAEPSDKEKETQPIPISQEDDNTAPENTSETKNDKDIVTIMEKHFQTMFIKTMDNMSKEIERKFKTMLDATVDNKIDNNIKSMIDNHVKKEIETTIGMKIDKDFKEECIEAVAPAVVKSITSELQKAIEEDLEPDLDAYVEEKKTQVTNHTNSELGRVKKNERETDSARLKIQPGSRNNAYRLKEAYVVTQNSTSNRNEYTFKLIGK